MLTSALLLASLALDATGETRSIERMAFDYRVVPNVVYRTLSTWSGRLDLYIPPEAGSRPTLVWIHGGGWTTSSKEEELLYILPYLDKGWSVAAVEYRLASSAPAPAAVEDCRCALAWLVANAPAYGISTSQVVLSGISAGGHLALASAGFAAVDGTCEPPRDFQPAAVVNWFGPSDVVELAFGERAGAQAIEWIQGRREVAEAVSPVLHIPAAPPPVLTIHGDADDLVPFSQSTRLHRLLTEKGAANELLRIEGAGHGEFSSDAIRRAYEALRRFLCARGLCS